MYELRLAQLIQSQIRHGSRLSQSRLWFLVDGRRRWRRLWSPRLTLGTGPFVPGVVWSLVVLYSYTVAQYNTVLYGPYLYGFIRYTVFSKNNHAFPKITSVLAGWTSQNRTKNKVTFKVFVVNQTFRLINLIWIWFTVCSAKILVTLGNYELFLEPYKRYTVAPYNSMQYTVYSISIQYKTTRIVSRKLGSTAQAQAMQSRSAKKILETEVGERFWCPYKVPNRTTTPGGDPILCP